MTREGSASDSPDNLSDEELFWVGKYRTELLRSISEHRTLRSSLVVGFVLGLAAHVGGYVLRSSAATEPLGLVADLLYALGLALWTGVVVAVLVQVFPRAKERQIKRALDAYDASVRDSTSGR